METNQRIRQIIKSQTAPYPPQGVLWVHEVESKQVKEVWKNGGWYPVETISLEEIWDLLDSCYYPLGDKEGALPTILDEIIDTIGKPSAPEVIVITTVEGEPQLTQEEIDRFIPMVKDNTIYNYVFQMSDSPDYRGRVISTVYLENAQGQPNSVFMTINFTRGAQSTNVVVQLLD